MTGCVKAGSAAGSYILANAAPAATPAAGGAASSDVRGTSGSTKSYNLTLKPSDDLSKHVNHKIEVTGTVSPASASASAGAGAAKEGASASATPTESFTVTSFKMVSATCP
jgi:hypothetical protein